MPPKNNSDATLDLLARNRAKVELEIRRRELLKEIERRNQTRSTDHPPEYYDFKKFAKLATDGFWDAEKHPHLNLIGDKLMGVESGDITRLMIFTPPRHAKSLSVSHLFPAWYLGKNPDRRLILTSYEADFAESWGRKARDLLGAVGPYLFGVQLAQAPAAARNWGIAFHRGGMNTAGVGGPITGRGGNVCFLKDTLVNTQNGPLPIQDFFYKNIKTPVWAYNHVKGIAELKPVVAAKRSWSKQIYTVFTERGRVLK
jgi:hypothetical protein